MIPQENIRNFSIIAHSAAAELKFAGTISAGEMPTSKRSVISATISMMSRESSTP